MTDPVRGQVGIEGDERVVDAFVQELQRAIDTADPVLFNRSFAVDVLWGSPFGAVVEGYDQLHAIHARMFGEHASQPGASRYTVEHVRFVAEGVVLAYVRRQTPHSASADRGPQPGRADTFDELSLFVLVQREARWWLAAAQHVPDRREVYASPSSPV
ncbi:MAG: SgcJ/EcaC family oxidoreductase [Polyangiales bacterium]